ncbi:MAG: DNA repair protein RecO [Deltaproteobacteria bacterium]|nr:DNA repair protein RecO [Deltaproteobacteria bacterium]
MRTRAFGESDKIVTFLTREFGKLSGIAKGARKSRRRFVASLEPFTHVQLGFRSRPQADLCFIESADIVRSARKLAFDLDRYAYSTYVVELIDSMVEGREAEPAVFDLAEATLARIDGSADSPSPLWLRQFEVELLALAGLEPRFDLCSRCRRPSAEPGKGFRFNPRTGCLCCDGCGDGSGIAVSEAAIVSMLLLQRGRPTELPASAGGEVRALLQTFIAHHLRRPLRSPALLREILGM